MTLYCLDRLDYFYAGYSSIVLVAVFLILDKVINAFPYCVSMRFDLSFALGQIQKYGFAFQGKKCLIG